MAHVDSLPQADLPGESATGPVSTARPAEAVRCSLCGAVLSTHALRYHVVSPQACDQALTVCHTCHKAALGEGYRPAR